MIMAKLIFKIEYKFTVWFYVLKLIAHTRMVKLIKNKTVAKCSYGNGIKVSDIIAI